MRLGVAAANADFHDREFGRLQELLCELEPRFGEVLVGAGVELLFEGEFQHAARDADALGDLLHFQFRIC